MHSNFRGEAIYAAEQDIHFPRLTVGDTLDFAAEARAPREPPGGITKREYGRLLARVVMSVLGISHTVNTKVWSFFGSIPMVLLNAPSVMASVMSHR